MHIAKFRKHNWGAIKTLGSIINQDNATAKVFQQKIEEALRIAKFYKKYPSNMLIEVDELDIMSNMKRDSVFTCELVVPGGTEIMAVSQTKEMWLPIAGRDKPIAVRVVEAGAMRSAAGGFNIQRYMHAYRLIDAIAGVKDVPDYYIGVTFGTNAHSSGNLVGDIKFSSWTNPLAELECLRLNYLEQKGRSSDGLLWFRPSVLSVTEAADAMLELRSSKERSRLEKRREGRVFESTKFNEPKYDVMQFCFENEFSFIDKILEQLIATCENIRAARPKTVNDLEKALVRSLPGSCVLELPG